MERTPDLDVVRIDLALDVEVAEAVELYERRHAKTLGAPDRGPG